MRKSLSEKTAVVLSLVLAAAAIVDQAGGQSLTEHADAMYASYGKQPSTGLLYGLLYAVAAANAVLWLIVLGVARSHRRAAAILAVLATAVSAVLAVVLLTASEYGDQLFPPLWGALALLPALAGTVATVLLFRRHSPTN